MATVLKKVEQGELALSQIVTVEPQDLETYSLFPITDQPGDRVPVQRLVELTMPAMREAGWGRFVAITSVAVREPQPGLVLSNALRAAVTGYLKSVSDEVAADGVTVNTVCPGYTATDRLEELAQIVAEREGSTVEAVFTEWASHAAIRRLLRPEEVAAAVGFLCSGTASGMTGVALPVDGGFGRSLI